MPQKNQSSLSIQPFYHADGRNNYSQNPEISERLYSKQSNTSPLDISSLDKGPAARFPVGDGVVTDLLGTVIYSDEVLRDGVVTDLLGTVIYSDEVLRDGVVTIYWARCSHRWAPRICVGALLAVMIAPCCDDSSSDDSSSARPPTRVPCFPSLSSGHQLVYGAFL